MGVLKFNGVFRFHVDVEHALFFRCVSKMWLSIMQSFGVMGHYVFWDFAACDMYLLHNM